MAKILIVEDEVENQNLLRRLMQRARYEAVFTDNKLDAVRLARADRPDLVLMDLKILGSPGGAPEIGGGLEAAAQIRAAPETSRIPIIAMTAQVMTDDRHRILQAGCDEIAAKPLVFKDLLDAIARRLSPTP